MAEHRERDGAQAGIPEHEQEAYQAFRAELEALPEFDKFEALVVKYGRQFGYRTVGRWIAGRAPKPKQESA